MKNIPSILAAVFLIAVLVMYMCTFQVRSTEVAIIKTFGQADRTPIRISDEDQSFFAGLHFKWPWPIQSVAKYDQRIRLLEDRIEETPTRDGKQVIVTTYTGWTISDPYKFHTQYQTVEAGADALRRRIRTHKKAVIGLHDFSQFVSTSPQERQLQGIEKEMMDAVVAEARSEFGIEVKAFGIKQFTVPQTVTEAVFKTMKAEQEEKARRYKSEGNAEATRIVSSAREARSRIMAVVDKKASDIESGALREVGELYKEFRDHQGLRMFLDSLDAYEEILRRRTTLIMDTGMAPINIMDEEKRIVKTPEQLDELLQEEVQGN